MGFMQAITKFESLPNELLIQSFQYLDAINLFHSFDCLNERFSTFIRSISLHPSLERVTEIKLIQFAIKLSSNSQIKEQITSLIIKSVQKFHNLQKLFTSNSLGEFSQLQTSQWFDSNLATKNQAYILLPSLPNLRHVSANNRSDSTR